MRPWPNWAPRTANIVALDADLSGSTKTGVFAKKFPERFFNMGIAEANMVGTAAGLAAVGKIPFVSTFAIFAVGRAWEQMRQSVAYPKANVKIVATHGGVTVGEDGGSHQSVEDIAIMRAVPNMTVIVPADGRKQRARSGRPPHTRVRFTSGSVATRSRRFSPRTTVSRSAKGVKCAPAAT